MTQEQTDIIKGNKLIAEFMGKEQEADSRYMPSEDLQYHLSWDWLMSAVEKIRGLGFNTCHCYEDITQKEYFSIYDDAYRNFAKGKQFYKEGKDCGWLAVVEFIKWYNNHKYVV